MKTHSRFTRIAIASGLIVASGAAVLGITGFASAELAGNNDRAAVVAPAADSTDDGDVATAQAVEGAAPAHDGGPRGSVSAANVAKVLGLTEAELRTELQTKSFVTIAGEKNVDIAKVKEALTADAKAHLDAEVASGKHTQAEADARLAAFTANLDAFVNAVRPAKGMGGRHGGGARFATEGLAKVYGITVTELQTELQTKSLAALATEKKVDIADVKAQLLSDYTAKEQAEVASGDHTQAEVDAKIAAFKANLDAMVNFVRPAGAPGMDGKGMGGRHGGGARFATEGLAKVYGITVTELQTELQTKSLAALATEKKVDIADVKAQLLSDYTAKEQAEVASGDHTQAEVDAKIAAFKANLDAMVNFVRPAGAPGMDGKGMGGHGGRHGHGHGDHGGMGGEPGAAADDATFSA